ncbi:unnamed protein product [Cochlearia groenlandica]
MVASNFQGPMMEISTHQPVCAMTFTSEESERMMTPHHDALIFTLSLANCLMKRILAATSRQVPRPRLHVGLQWNIGKTLNPRLESRVIHTPLDDKVHDSLGVRKIKGDQENSRSCYTLRGETGMTMQIEDQPVTKEASSSTEEPDVEKIDEIPLDETNTERKVNIGSKLPENVRQKLIDFLRSNADCVAWSHANMSGFSDIKVYCDSQLFVSQIQGDYQAKDSSMTRYLAIVKKLKGFVFEDLYKDT